MKRALLFSFSLLFLFLALTACAGAGKTTETPAKTDETPSAEAKPDETIPTASRAGEDPTASGAGEDPTKSPTDKDEQTSSLPSTVPEERTAGYPVKKLLPGRSVNPAEAREHPLLAFGGAIWDGNGDGIEDQLSILYAGSGLSFEDLFFTDGASGERISLRSSVNNFVSIGFEEGGDGAPLLFSSNYAFFPKDSSYALAAPFARLEVRSGAPTVVYLPLYSDKDRTVGFSKDTYQISADGRTYAPIDDETLEKTTGFYAEIHFTLVRTSESGHMYYADLWHTLSDASAKDLYRLLRGKTNDPAKESFSALWADRSFVLISFFTRNDGAYRFCGSFSVQGGVNGGDGKLNVNFGEIYEEDRGFDVDPAFYEEVKSAIESAL